LAKKRSHPDPSKAPPWLYVNGSRDILTYDRLRDIAADTPAKLREGGPSLAAYFLAMRLLSGFFGQEWVERHPWTTNAAKEGYLRSRFTAGQSALDIHVMRSIRLAEMLFNQQHVAGFDKV
jgi:hypothetical protein